VGKNSGETITLPINCGKKPIERKHYLPAVAVAPAAAQLIVFEHKTLCDYTF
jgi:hypothetical protein